MIQLYGVYRSRVSRNVWLCLEVGLPFQQVPVIQSYRVPEPHAADAPLNTASPAFLAINPMGLVPCMQDGELTLIESLAINLYLARKIGAPLGAASLAEDGQIAQWTLWAATEVEPKSVAVMFNRIPDAGPDQTRTADEAVAGLARPLGVLEAYLADRSYLVADRFTVADINVAEVLRYAQTDPAALAAFPAVRTWLAACQARPAFVEMMARRNAEPAWAPPRRP
jgi:glutathione S-transferase